jgi:hypothetical protein
MKNRRKAVFFCGSCQKINVWVYSCTAGNALSRDAPLHSVDLQKPPQRVASPQT